eukprot:CAMPEP_0117577410 /NCGR_PEP_ID=MMETSP0784-20121206/63409_1 /TAXON_ID=39447 /ORGANISM="" /LENGTH=108 /DNA_ID=CAMNT_0005376913 /DNA_START=75 /DNA_END=400 /DNA_ORIENTATION=-
MTGRPQPLRTASRKAQQGRQRPVRGGGAAVVAVGRCVTSASGSEDACGTAPVNSHVALRSGLGLILLCVSVKRFQLLPVVAFDRALSAAASSGLHQHSARVAPESPEA